MFNHILPNICTLRIVPNVVPTVSKTVAMARGFTPRKRVVLAKVAISGTDFDPEEKVGQQKDSFVSDEANQWQEKLKPFTGTLKEVPPKETQPAAHKRVVEENNGVILNYVKTQLLANGVTEAVYLQWITPISTSAPADQKSGQTIIVLKKLLSRGKWKGFMEAVGLQTQVKRELMQQMPDIGISEEDFALMQDNLRKIAAVRSEWGKFTSTKKFVLETTTAVKLAAQKEMATWFEANTSELVKIVSMTVNDIPLTYAASEMGAFEADPTNVVNKKKVEAALVKLQKEAYTAWKADKANFKLATFLGTK